MRLYPTRFVILLLLLTLLLAACGDATGTVIPATQPTATQPVTATIVGTTTAPIRNEQITPAPGQLPTKTSQPATTPAKTNVPTATPSPVKPEFIPVVLGQPFMLDMGQFGSLGEAGLTVKFLSITEDSRCPNANGGKSVQCFWAGQVTVQLQVKQGNNPAETIKLTLPGATSQTTIPASAIKNLGNYNYQKWTPIR